MRKIGIVVCNFNKQDYIINCIRSIFASTTDDFDVYVVDNASTDDSVKMIEREFENRLTLIVNKENLGGSGGFNTGLREALTHDYQYLMCIDNDVVLDPHAIEELQNFLEIHPDVGMVGSKVYFMDEPEKIWNYGGIIDFENFIQKDQYKNLIDTDLLPEIVYGDYVPACSMMVRTDVVRKVGVMSEENFIYWDDMEWGYRFRQAGWKVAAYGKAKVWHKAGGRNAGNTFIHYYMWRNRIHFFLSVLAKEERDRFADTILEEMFRMIYSVNLKGETNIIKTLMYAFDDAVHGVRGKAAEGKILERPQVRDRLEELLGECKSILILFNGDFEGLGNVVRHIQKGNKEISITIAVKEKEQLHKVSAQYLYYEVISDYTPEKYDTHLIMCSHIFQLPEEMAADNYIDSWCNLIYCTKDFEYCRSFQKTKELFILCKKQLLLNT